MLVRLPLWPSAMLPVAVERKVGCAFFQTLAPGGGVAAVPDGQMTAGQGLQGRLVEDLGDQAHVLEDHDLAAATYRDASRLLPAVLQGVESEIGQFGDLVGRGPHPEDTTGVLWAAVLRIEIVIE